MNTKEKIIEILNGAECAVYWDGSNQGFIEKIADYLIANGVTVKVKKEKPPVDLTGKCGSCVWAVKDTGTFGKSLAYVRCTNSDRFGSRRYREHPLTAVRQRTAKACKKYVPQPAEQREEQNAGNTF